jgi:hypothetical protein
LNLHELSLEREDIFSHARKRPYALAGEIVRSENLTRRTNMKTIFSALLALTVLSGIVSSASAFDAKSFYDQQDRQRGG